MRWGVAFLLAAGCGFEVSSTPSDASVVPPDVGPCTALGDSCSDERTLQRCTSMGMLPTPTVCAWRCEAALPAHCTELVPAGGGVEPVDLQQANVVTLTNATLNSDGTIMGNSGMFVRRESNGIAVFSAGELQINGRLVLLGNMPIAFAIRGQIEIDGEVDARGTCVNNLPGPGGFPGGNYTVNGMGLGGGTGAPSTNTGGGGGAGHGAVGGQGGMGTSAGSAPGVVYGPESIPLLVGGSGGGGGGGGGGNNNKGYGGGGGAAIQFASNLAIRVTQNGSINAGGCGGNGSNNATNDGAGGGGAGGTILLEAPMVAIFGVVAVNGGGGGAAKDNKGASGTASRSPAPGGDEASDGGPGGYGLSLVGGQGMAGTAGGGGGGAVGRIRINTATGSVQVMSSLMSPAIDDMPTTATAAIANSQ